MKLTEEVKNTIDSLTDEEFLFCYLVFPEDISTLTDETSQYIEERFRKIAKTAKIS